MVDRVFIFCAYIFSMSNTNTVGTDPTRPNPDVTVPTPDVVGSNPGLVPPGSNGGGTNVGYGYNYGYNGYGPLYTSGATRPVSRCDSIMFTIVLMLSFACMYIEPDRLFDLAYTKY